MKRYILIAHRKAKGLTQQQLGNLVGLSKQSICEIESGRSDPSYRVGREIEKVFGFAPCPLFDLGSQPHKTV